MIYVQVASYRDPELLPTILDCIAKAKYKCDLTFGICWQRADSDDSLKPFLSDSRFRIDDVPWHDSHGPSWARSRIQRYYDGEEFTLQIDSHHRFVDGWDVQLLKYIELVESPKPILTSYGTGYNPESFALDPTPSKIGVAGFSSSGILILRPEFIKDWSQLDRPIRARFVSAHFLFTGGSYCTDFKHDPRNYYAGEELAMSIRCFTMGYDLFHPHRPVLWHNYTRKGRVMHWSDHLPKVAPQVEVPWHERLAVSKMRLRKLVRQDENAEDVSDYDLGSIRTHRDYELYAGIDFENMRLHNETIDGTEPPCTYTGVEQWEGNLTREHIVTLKWGAEAVNQCDDLRFIYFGVEDDEGTVLHRYDARPDSDEARQLVNEKSIKFRSPREPVKFVVWPVSQSRGWLTRAVYQL